VIQGQNASEIITTAKQSGQRRDPPIFVIFSCEELDNILARFLMREAFKVKELVKLFC
jgi:hypothetical protein